MCFKNFLKLLYNNSGKDIFNFARVLSYDDYSFVAVLMDDEFS